MVGEAIEGDLLGGLPLFNGSGVAAQIELRKIVVDHMLPELDRILDIRAIAVGHIPFDNIFVWQDLLEGGFYGQS